MPIVRLSRLAEDDIENILEQSELSFGQSARLRYEALLEAALRDIAENSERPGVRYRDELGSGVRTYHLFFSRANAASDAGVVRRPRHMLVFRRPSRDVLYIARVLHDAMDLNRHLPPEEP